VVVPTEVIELGDLLIVPRLEPLWQQVIASSLEFSGIGSATFMSRLRPDVHGRCRAGRDQLRVSTV